MILSNHSYLIQEFYTQLYGFNYFDLTLIICQQLNVVLNCFKVVNILYT